MEAEAVGPPVIGPEPSPKSYGTAVLLSALLGFVGAQHFYLRRPGEAFLDVGLSLGWMVSLALGRPLLAVLFFLLDAGHALTVTILLLIGRFRDGSGRVVCYPGQRLGGALSNHPMRRNDP